MTAMMDALHLAEHFKLKEQYGRYLKIAGLLAIFAHLIGAVFSPPYVPRPYEIRDQILQLVEIPDDIVIPPPPKTIERPQIPADMEISELANPLTTIAPTDVGFSDMLPPPSADLETSGDVIVTDAKPVVLHQVIPAYPELARQAEAEGTVYVRVTVGETGKVLAAQVVQSNATESLEQAAVAAAHQWLFKPAMQGREKVKSMIVIPFVFSLD